MAGAPGFRTAGHPRDHPLPMEAELVDGALHWRAGWRNWECCDRSRGSASATTTPARNPCSERSNTGPTPAPGAGVNRKSVDQQATNRGRADPGATFDPSRPSGSQGVSLFLAEGAHGLITQEEAVSLGDCVA